LFQIYKLSSSVVADMLYRAEWFELQSDTNWSCI